MAKKGLTKKDKLAVLVDRKRFAKIKENVAKRALKMGTCKDNMNPKQTTKPKDGDKVFGVFKRKSRIRDPQTSAQTLADMVNNADIRLNELIVTKQTELKNETGEEDYNRKALGCLETMQFHLDKISDIAVEYSDLR